LAARVAEGAAAEAPTEHAWLMAWRQQCIRVLQQRQLCGPTTGSRSTRLAAALKAHIAFSAWPHPHK
jgi:hypothetical protein